MENKQMLQPVALSLHEGMDAGATMYPMACQEYDAVKNAGRGYMYVSHRERGIGLMDWHGRLILSLMWDRISPYFDDRVIVAAKGKTLVLFDLEGKPLIGQPLETLLDGKNGALVLDKNGETIRVEAIGDFCERIAICVRQGKRGYLRSDGKYIMDAPYALSGAFHNGLAMHEKKNGFLKPKTYGYFSRQGVSMIPATYRNAADFSEGYAAVNAGSGWVYIDASGKPLEMYAMVEGKKVPMPTVDRAEAFKNGYARVMKMGQSTVLPGGDGTVIIREDGEGGWGLINKNGLMTVPARFNWLSDANEQGICQFGVSGSENVGLISVDGTVLLRPVFSQIMQMRRGMFALQTEGGWWIADKNGRVIGKKAYDQIGRLPSDGVCVREGDRWRIIDHSGDRLTPLCSEMDFCLHRGAALIKRNGEYLLCGKDMRELNPIRFEEAGNLLAGLAMVKWQGNSYLLDYGFEPEKEHI